MTGQMLTVAVQNGVDRRRLGVAMGTTTFLRGLGGAIGAAALGAIFAARVGTGPADRADVIDAVQTVFLVAAPLAAIALLIVLRAARDHQRVTGGPHVAPRHAHVPRPARR